ncbi:MAG: DUF2612 domain-containing protein [Candidatus Omnitrophota bacterium]
MINQKVSTPQKIGIGDNTETNFLVSEHTDTTIESVFVNDWQGNNLQYQTPRTNYVPSSVFGIDTSLTVDFINGPSQTGIDAPDGSNDAVRCWALPENMTFDVSVNDTYINGDNDFNNLFTGINKIVLCSTTADISNGIYYWSFFYRIQLGSVITIISPETGTSHSLTGDLNTWYRAKDIPISWAGGASELNITIQNNEGAIIDFFGGQIELTQTTPYIRTTNGAVTTVDYAAINNEIIFSIPPKYGALISWTGEYNYDGFDFNKTIISQYANSPTINRLIYNMSQYIDATVDIKNFYDYVWNVDTAQGFGLDIWGRIVDIKRQLEVDTNPEYAGFYTGANDWQTMGSAPFYSGELSTQILTLSDRAYRTLIIAKALSNITITTAPAINQLLQNLFPGRGRSYVNDHGLMRMRYTFEFALLPFEIAIVNSLNILPHGAGVHVSVLQITYPFLGFNEQGYGVTTMSFNDTRPFAISGNAIVEASASGEITLIDTNQINRTFWGDFNSGVVYGAGDHNWKNAPTLDGTSTIDLISDGSGGYYAAFTVNSGEQLAEVSMMQDASNADIVENENSGGQIYEFSVMLDSTWQSMSVGGYANIVELIALDRNLYSPAFAIDVHNKTITLFSGDVVGRIKQDFALSISEYPLNEWIDFRLSIDYKKTETGYFKVEEKLRSSANYTTVLSLENIATLQYSSEINGGAVPDHVMHIGLSRSNESFTSIIYHDGFTRNTSGVGVLHGAGDSVSSNTGLPTIESFISGTGSVISSGSGALQFDDLPVAGSGLSVSSATGQASINQPVAGDGLSVSDSTGSINVQVPSNITFFGGFDTGLTSAANTNNQNWYQQAISVNGSIVITSSTLSQYAAKFTVPPSGTTGSETTMVSRFQNNAGQIIYENISSGTQVYKFSTMFDPSWQPMTSTSPSGRWAIIMQLRNASGTFNPAFRMNVGDSGGAALTISSRGGNQNIVTTDTRVFLTDQTLPKGDWINWILTINYATDNTGFAHLDRKNPGATTFTRVASIDNVPTLQWNNANSDPGQYYMEMGLYRGPQDPSTSIISFDGFTREPYAVTSTVTVPNIVGITATAANSTITGAGLLVGTVTNQGIVISQLPAAGTVVNAGSAIDYVMNISNITITNQTSTSVQITFTFNEVSQAQVEYGITTAYGSLGGKETSFNYSTHTQTITGLVSNQTYHFRIHGWNQAGIESISNDAIFLTTASAIQCVVPATSSTIRSVKTDFGAVGNGTVNDTTAIQNAFNNIGGTGGTVRIPAGTYLVNTNALNLKSNMTLEMDSGAIIKAASYTSWSTAIEHYSVIHAQSCTNLNIIGGQIMGERATHPPKVLNFTASFSGAIMTVTAINGTLDVGVLNSKIVGAGLNQFTWITSARAGTGPGGTNPNGGLGQYNIDTVGGGTNGTLSSRPCSQYTGQHGHGLNIIGCTNTFVEGLIAKDCWGDGIYIGGAKCTNIKVCSVICDNNRRVAIAVTWANTVLIKNSQFLNTNGTDPCSGIDIEPNPAPIQSTVENVTIQGSLFKNNPHGGIVLHLPQRTEAPNLYIRNTIIENNIIENNHQFAGVTVQTPGSHIVRNNIVRNNVGYGILYDFNASNGSITGNTIYGNTFQAIAFTQGTSGNVTSGNVTNTGAPVTILDLGTNP